MAKKRHYYDSRGRYRGHSSNQSPQQRNAGALLILFGLLVIPAIFFGKNDKDSQQQETAVEATSVDSVSKTSNARIESSNSAAADVPAVQSSAPAPAVVTDVVETDKTKEYLDANYFNGDTSCPRDIIEKYAEECVAGDEQQCAEASRCGAL